MWPDYIASKYVETFLYIVFCYLAGAVPFGYLAGRLNGVDLREHGSRNIGATNAMRVLGRKWGIPVFLLDFVKGYAPVFLWLHVVCAYLYGEGTPEGYWWHWGGAVLAGLAAVLGHTYTCFLGLKGGKGVATTAGVLLALSPFVWVVSMASWVVVLWLTRYVSLASIAAGVIMVVTALYEFGYFAVSGWCWRPEFFVVVLLVFICVLVILKHRGNLERVVQGVEPKVFQRSKKSDEE